MGCSRHKTSDTEQASSRHETLTPVPDQTAFVLTDVDGRTTTLTLQNARLRLSRVVQPTVILHFFTTRADLGRAMLPYLSDLQRKRAKRVFVVGLVVPESLDAAFVREYMHQNDTTFFVSHASDNLPLGHAIASMLKLDANYPLPLTVVFDHGRCVTHYEGVTPIEMIRNDLNDLQSTTGRPK